MILTYPFVGPVALAIMVILMDVCYYRILKKMGLDRRFAVLPCLAEWQLSTVLLQRMRSFWRPFVIAGVLTLFAIYLNPYSGSGKGTAHLFILIAAIVYSFFMLRLYTRLSRSFGRGRGFAFLSWLLPPLGLGILGFGKREYQGPPTFKPLKSRTPAKRRIRRTAFIVVSIIEVAALVGGVGFLTVRAYPPQFMVQMSLRDADRLLGDVTGTGDVITREDAMGDDAASLASMPTSRDKYFPTHAQDESVVVMEYIVGADLEDKAGLSSANIAQMMNATKQGDDLTFVLQCGGSKRWFTRGISNGSYARYDIRGGTLTKAQDLPGDMCMSEPEELASFITWAKETYPADRYMLVLWDHGGGLGSGFGMDAYNERDTQIPMMSVSEVSQALEEAGVKFDLVGFDACLMQEIEIATALEPYADYYLASEEVEGGFGWPYTSAFGKLAQNPGMETEDFAYELIASYDPYNTIVNDDEPDTSATLSLVDLTYVKPAYDQMETLFGQAQDAIEEDSTSYANLSLSGTKAYTFQNKEQIDLIDFLSKLDELDYDDRICSQEERDALIDAVRACVVYRNANSAEGANGMAVAFPCQSVYTYNYSHDQLKALSFEAEENLYNVFFSIMTAQKMKSLDDFSLDGDVMSSGILGSDLMNAAMMSTVTTSDWYVEGFEDYESQDALIDIPLLEQEDGYQIELPERAWGIIADYKLRVSQRTDDGLLRYLGQDDAVAYDDADHPMVAMDGTWVHVGGQLACYESGLSRETDAGTVFTGTAKAMLNGSQEVILHIEWDPVGEGEDAPATGHVTGYEVADDGMAAMLVSLLGEDSASALNAKALEELTPGDSLRFMFDCYDDEGNLVKSEPMGRRVLVSNMQRLEVADAPLGECDVVFGGVLTDVYQRTMLTEQIEAHVAG